MTKFLILKKIISIILLTCFNVLLVNTLSSQEDLNEILTGNCECLSSATNQSNILEIEESFNHCLEALFDSVISFDSSLLNSRNDYTNFIYTKLKETCPDFNKYDSIQYLLSNNKLDVNSFNTSKCKVIRNSVFVDFNTNKDTILFNDSIQKIHFNDGSKTVSKITWLSNCSYRLTPIQSNEKHQSKILKNRASYFVEIIDVVDEIYYYQFQIDGKFFRGKMILVKAQ